MVLRDQAFRGVVAHQRLGGLLLKMLAYQGTHMAVDMRVTVGGLPNGERRADLGVSSIRTYNVDYLTRPSSGATEIKARLDQ